jgi:hypothetical protein
MQPSSYRGAAAISGLVTLASSTLSGVVIIDGPAPNKPNERELVMIGWAPFVDRHTVARRVDEDLGGRMTEEGEIACYIAVGHGDTTIIPVRDRATDLLTQLEAAIREENTLGGSVDESSVGPNMTLTQYQDPNEGASVGLSFAVSYRAWI